LKPHLQIRNAQKLQLRNNATRSNARLLFQAARLNLLHRQVTVAAKSDTIAQRRFEVAKERYVIGKIDIPILFIAQSEKDGARQANFQTLSDFWVAYFRVRRLTLFDFGTGESLTAEHEGQ